MTNQYERLSDEQKIANAEMLETVEHSYLLKNQQQSAQESWLSQEYNQNILKQVQINQYLLELLNKARRIAEESRIMAELAQSNAKKAWAKAELAQLNTKKARAMAELAKLNTKKARAMAELVILKSYSHNREISE